MRKGHKTLSCSYATEEGLWPGVGIGESDGGGMVGGGGWGGCCPKGEKCSDD